MTCWKSCSRARARYHNYLDAKKSRLKKNEMQEKKAKTQEELKRDNKSRAVWTMSYDRHIKNANDLALKAEAEKKFSLIAESNASRVRAREIVGLLEESAPKLKSLR